MDRPQIVNDGTPFYHEDDFCQQEFLPAGLMHEVRSELEKLRSFSERHRSGAGWDDIYVRSTDLDLSALGLRLDLVRGRLPRDWRVFGTVTTGYSTYAEVDPRTVAVGPSVGEVVFLRHERGTVRHAWLSHPRDPAAAGGVLTGGVGHLLYVDWSGGTCEVVGG